MLRVAIDGPGGTGKSTIAKAVAERFGLEYIDTGAMYRALGLKALRNGVDAADEEAVRAMLADTSIDFVSGHTHLDGEDVSGLIRTNEISMAASNISKLAIVRAKVDEVSRHLAATKDVVMEGRDIGTVVFPNADVKIFLDCDVKERAKRRFIQNQKEGIESTYEEILDNIIKREKINSTREIAPFVKAEDAIYLDSTNLTIEEVVEKVIELIDAKKGM